MGKTRLALAAAEQLASQAVFREGVAFADLTAIDTTDELDIALAAALGLPSDRHSPSPRSQVLDYLRTKQVLLILDNCEQIRDQLATLAVVLLDEAPEVTLLATSRERLGLQAERVFLLDGMDAHDDGVALFIASARCAQPDFALDAHVRFLVQAICARLSGMPLAIELAARWANTLSLTVINDELAHSYALLASHSRDRPERHRSIRTVCEAAWIQLQPADQLVFAQIAVFRGGATWQAIHAVTGATPWQIQALVERALMRFDPRSERYIVHELLRQHAEERLQNDPAAEQSARARHAACFLGYLAACTNRLKGADQWATLAVINADIENLRAAWRWASRNGSIDLIAPAIEALSLTYAWLGHHAEGLAVLELTIATLRHTTPSFAAALRTAQAYFALNCGKRAQALDLLGEAQALLARSERDATVDATLAGVLLQLGRTLAHNDFAAAYSALTRSKAQYEALNNRWGEATALAELGRLLTNMSANYSEARVLLGRSAAGFRALGDQIGLSEALMTLCRTNRNIGLFPEALATAREVFAIAEASGNTQLLAQAGSTLGTMLAIGNQYEEAYTRLAAALDLTHELGRRNELPNLYCAQGYVAAFLGRYTEARIAYTSGLRIAQQIGDELERCSLLSGLAGLALAERCYSEALSLADAALTLSDQLGEGYLRSRSLPYRALALRGLRSGDRGRSDAVATLRLGLAARSEILVVLWVVALLLADAGELTRAAEVFLLSEQKRLLDNVWLQDIALRELRAMMAGLPPATVSQARARWAQHDIWVAVDELCTELETVWFRVPRHAGLMQSQTIYCRTPSPPTPLPERERGDSAL
jgi:predicted ATPase/tetratricopeptide (TPR) repeat protein